MSFSFSRESAIRLSFFRFLQIDKAAGGQVLDRGHLVAGFLHDVCLGGFNWLACASGAGLGMGQCSHAFLLGAGYC